MSQAGTLKNHIRTHTGEKPYTSANGATSLQSQRQALPTISSGTLRRRHIIARSAGGHSVHRDNRKAPFAFILEKSHLSAHNAVTQVAGPIVSNDI